MDKYLNLLVQASNKSDYRKSPLKTAEEVDKLVKKVKKDKVELKAKRIVDYDLSSPMRVKISEARIKAGRKAFKDQTKLFENNKRYQDLKNKLTSLRQSGASQQEIDKANKDIEEFFNVQNKKIDLEREVEKYKDEPLKYLAKLQELKNLETKPQQQNPQLEEIKQLLQAQLTPAQLLQTDKEFKTLSARERDEALKRLTQATPRDTSGRKEIVLNFLKKTPQEKKEYINKIKSSVPEKTIKATEFQEKRPVGRPKKLVEEVVLSQRVSDLLNRTTFDDDDQKKFVSDTIMKDVDDGQYNDSDSNEELQASINFLKSNYVARAPKATDLNFKQAMEEDNNENEIDALVSRAIKKASDELAAEQVVAKFEHPEDEPIVAELANVLEVNDDLKPEEAEQDARDAVSAANAELNIKARESEEGADIILDKEGKPIIGLRRRMEYFPLFQKEFGVNAYSVLDEFVDPLELYDTSDILKIIADIKKTYIPPTAEEPESEQQTQEPQGKKKAGRPKKQKAKIEITKKAKGKGFKPLAEFPLHLVAGSLSKHVERVRRNRHNTRVNKMAVLNNVDNQEYRQNMTKHILNGNRLGQWLNV